MLHSMTGPLLPRRAVLRGGAIAASGLVLPACVTTRAASPASVSASCLPPVLVDPSRVIRTVAGLRPYRASGFVVREEPFASKRIVHNYGHGGAGITLSWGTSRLAVDIGLQGHSGEVAVLGAGVMGLSTARLVQEAGFSVTIYTAALPPETTSNIAGGQFHPFGHFREEAVTPEWREQFRRAVDYSWRRFQILVGDEYGIRWLPTYSEGTEPEARLIPNFPPVNRILSRAEHPFPIDNLIRYDTMYVEVGKYLRQMIRDVRLGGGDIRILRLGSREALTSLPQRLIFNCTGLGSRELFGDQGLRPARGQLAVLLPQPEVQYALNSESGYMFPRADGILLGGTFELDKWSTEPDPARIARILASHQRLFGGFRCAPVASGGGRIHLR